MTAQTGSGRVLALVLCGVLAPACASVTETTRSVKYTLAGANTGARKTLESGLLHLKAENYPAALGALNRAIWELERIEEPALRLEELAAAHHALADVYSSLRKSEWAEEQRALANALSERRLQSPDGFSPEQGLARGKSAYGAARFREAAAAFSRALVDLEEIKHPPARIKSLEEARCYLAFSYFALDDRDRAKEEFRRLASLDGSLTFCYQEAPPAIRQLMAQVREGRG